MYQLVIADDEISIRESLSDLVDWNSLGFEVVGIFSDGQEVIEYLEYLSVDVIITDIKMTYVSGLDIARYNIENNCGCKIVFISAHEEFNFAVEGMKYGVKDYLLKPTNIKSISETFIKIRQTLDKERELKVSALKDKKKYQEIIPIIQTDFFSGLILGMIDNPNFIKGRMQLIYPNEKLTENCCFLADVVIDNYAKYLTDIWSGSQDYLNFCIEQYLLIYNKDIFVNLAYKSEDFLNLFVIIQGEKGSASSAICKELFERFIKDFTVEFGFELSYEITHIFDNIYQVPAYRQENVYFNKNGENGNQNHLLEQKKLILANISNGNVLAAQRILNVILDELKMTDPVLRNNFIVEIFSAINETVKTSYVNLSEGFAEHINYTVLISQNSIESIKKCCDRIFSKLNLLLGKSKKYDSDSLVSKVQQYVKNNITKDISLDEVAGELYISSGYLSRIFKKQTGESFVQYVTREKMNIAIEMLRHRQYKTYQIGEYLGFQTPRYFSKLFKMQTGMTPSEYRSNILQIGGGIHEEL